MSAENILTIPAYAKINWSLRVLGRRSDGWHQLETIFQTIDFCDLLTFELINDSQIIFSSSGSEDVPADETNLVYRAARALQSSSTRRGARIHLEKNIPAGGGLGGGSSDAAVTLLALAHLWELKISFAELVTLGAQLGADVPFFLTGGTALGTGTGTTIYPLPDTPPQQLLIVTPREKVLTAEAYQRLKAPALTKPIEDIKLTVSRAAAQISDFRVSGLRNDFEPSVFSLKPEIARVHRALLTQGAPKALLSGSGASVFGVFENQQALERAALALAGETNWRVRACATVTRARYRQSFGPASGAASVWLES